MLAEGELRANLDESDKVRDLQDRLADMKAEVGKIQICISIMQTALVANDAFAFPLFLVLVSL